MSYVSERSEEFQKAWKRYAKIRPEPKMNIHQILTERAKRMNENKNEIDFIIEDIVKAKDQSGIPIAQRMKFEDMYKGQSELQKFHKEKILELFDKSEPRDIFDDLNRQLREAQINDPMAFDFETERPGVERRTSFHGLEKEDIKVLTESFSPQLRRSFADALINSKIIDRQNTFGRKIETISTHLQTEDNELVKNFEKGVNKKILRAVEKQKKIKKFVDSIEKYEKVLDKSRNATMKKIDEYYHKKYFLRKKYNNVYNDNFTIFQ
jgi:hypothetical protein